MKKQFWYKITKWSTPKPDFCKVYAEDETHAMYCMEDQLKYHHNVNCEYFSTKSNYRRGIDDIMNFELVDFSEVQKHIDKINYAIEHQENEELTV